MITKHTVYSGSDTKGHGACKQDAHSYQRDVGHATNRHWFHQTHKTHTVCMYVCTHEHTGTHYHTHTHTHLPSPAFAMCSASPRGGLESHQGWRRTDGAKVQGEDRGRVKRDQGRHSPLMYICMTDTCTNVHACMYVGMYKCMYAHIAP